MVDMTDTDDNRQMPAVAPTLRVIPMPSDTNAEGDIFGGWLLSQMDLAGASLAYEKVGRRIVTVGVTDVRFHRPVLVGDEVSFYSTVRKIGNTSIGIHVEAWAKHRLKTDHRHVAEGVYTFVAIDDNRKPVKIEEQ